MKLMRAIRALLKNNPDLLKCGSVNLDKREKRQRYNEFIKDNYDKLEDIAREYRIWVAKIPGWRLELGEKVFNFGKRIAGEYDLHLQEVGRLFNEILPQRMRGPLLGFFISGAYNEVIQEDDLLCLNLSRYTGTVSGLGYRHSKGRLEILGKGTYCLGVKMESGEILLRGNVGSHVGKFMQGGQIIIQGNAGNWIGQHMRGGLIRIRGNARDIIGKKMTGGEIVIEGDAGCWVADEMRKGIIRIQGEYGSLDEERRGGEIFQWQEDRWKRIEYGEVLGRARIC